MFLIPYIYLQNENINRFYIFLNQGKLFLQMHKNEIEDFCKENEIYFSKQDFFDDYCYIKVSKNTNLKQFYSYTENSSAECWRNFIYFEDDSVHINTTNPEFIQPILKNILLLEDKQP